MNSYGKELILDLHYCNPDRFTRKSIKDFFKKLCDLIDMKREKLYWWDDLYTPEEEKETKAHLAGTSAVQFIKTSNITIHTLDKLRKVYLNIFSCKDFCEDTVIYFSCHWFDGMNANCKVIRRV